jgi:indole-3-glycerol phosphate synthase
MGFLSEVMEDLRARLAAEPPDDGASRELLSGSPPARDLAAALSNDPPSILAEIKRASPSAGTIAARVDPASLAIAYAEGGAAAVSVLTDSAHFGGSLGDLDAVRLAVEIPVLRKDFLVVPGQVLEARAHGADSVLLITACLSDDELMEMLAAARELGMEPLVETHSDRDLDRALATDARMVGVNARDLQTLQVDLRVALDRVRRVGPDRVTVLESGVATRGQVEAAIAAGASAILVGEALMRAGDPAAAIRELRGTG